MRNLWGWQAEYFKIYFTPISELLKCEEWTKIPVKPPKPMLQLLIVLNLKFANFTKWSIYGADVDLPDVWFPPICLKKFLSRKACPGSFMWNFMCFLYSEPFQIFLPSEIPMKYSNKNSFYLVSRNMWLNFFKFSFYWNALC